MGWFGNHIRLIKIRFGIALKDFTVELQFTVLQSHLGFDRTVFQRQIFFVRHASDGAVHHQPQGLGNVFDTCLPICLIVGIDAENAACLTDCQLLEQFLRNCHVKSGFGFFQHITEAVQIFCRQTFKQQFAADIDIALRHREFEGLNI